MKPLESARPPWRDRARRIRRLGLLSVALVGACELQECAAPVSDVYDFEGVVTINDLPAPGVEVYGGGESVLTGPNGQFRLTVRLDGSALEVAVRPPAGIYFENESVLLVAATTSTDNIEFVGYRAASISGTVQAFNQPVPGVQLKLVGIGFSTTTTSAADGSYRFDAVPPSFVTSHVLTLVSGPFGFALTISPTFVALRGVDRVVNLTGFFSDGYEISGYVTVDGAGLGGVIVTVMGAWTAVDTTTASGLYTTLRLPPGPYTVSIANFDAAAIRFPATSQPVTLSADARIDFDGTQSQPAQPPVANIIQPASGATFVEGTSIALQGTGTDPEDGALAGASLTWTSSIDGVLGTGATISFVTNSVGTHTITLTATDAGGLTGAATVNITVTAGPQLPGSISGVVTGNGAPIGGVAVTLSGTASASATTSNNGTYSFPGLTPGTYTVTITSPFPGIEFPATSQTVTLGSGQNLTVDFPGTYGSIPPR